MPVKPAPSGKTAVVALLSLIFSVTPLNLFTAPAAQNIENLDTILPLLAEYCSRFADASLNYICMEEIHETIYTPPRALSYSYRGFREHNRYVYDYQLIYKDGLYKERRILVKENGKDTNEQNAPLKVKRSPYEYLIAGPIGLFSEYWQPFYDYTILKTARLKGQKVWVIDVKPKPGVKHQYLYGKAWISTDNLSVQKIEYNQKALRNIQEIQKSAEDVGMAPDITIVTEFAYEKNGIRFPSECSISENYMRSNSRGGQSTLKYQKSKLIITYSDYKFFTVETQVDIKRK